MTRVYADTQSFFEAVRRAALEMERAERQVARMRAAEGVHGQGYGMGGRSGDVDSTAATDARIDYECIMEARIDEDRELVKRARRVCYGEDGSGGVRSLLNSVASDALWLRYGMGKPWEETARTLGVDRKTARRWCDTAFDVIDAVGMSSAIAGSGVAEL